MKLESMYQYSLEWFIDIFLRVIKTAEKPERNLQQSLTAFPSGKIDLKVARLFMSSNYLLTSGQDFQRWAAIHIVKHVKHWGSAISNHQASLWEGLHCIDWGVGFTVIEYYSFQGPDIFDRRVPGSTKSYKIYAYPKSCWILGVHNPWLLPQLDRYRYFIMFWWNTGVLEGQIGMV